MNWLALSALPIYKKWRKFPLELPEKISLCYYLLLYFLFGCDMCFIFRINNSFLLFSAAFWCRSAQDRSHFSIMFGVFLWVCFGSYLSVGTFKLPYCFQMKICFNMIFGFPWMRSVHGKLRLDRSTVLGLCPFPVLLKRSWKCRKNNFFCCRLNAQHNAARCNHELFTQSGAGSLLREVTNPCGLGE